MNLIKRLYCFLVGHRDNNVYQGGKEYELIGKICFACKRWKPAKRSVKLETYEQTQNVEE